MAWLKRIWRHLRAFGGDEELEREIDDELRFHLELRTRDNLARGMTAEEARADAWQRFGDYERIKHLCRESSRERVADRLGLKALKMLIWLILAGGILLRTTSPIRSVQQVGDVTMVIAILWRLLIQGRALRALKDQAGIGRESALPSRDHERSGPPGFWERDSSARSPPMISTDARSSSECWPMRNSTRSGSDGPKRARSTSHAQAKKENRRACLARSGGRLRALRQRLGSESLAAAAGRRSRLRCQSDAPGLHQSAPESVN